MRLVVMCCFVVGAAVSMAAHQQVPVPGEAGPVTVTLKVPSAVFAAAERRISSLPVDVDEQGLPVPVEARVGAWMLQALRTELRAELEAIRQERAAAVETDTEPLRAKIKGLSKQRCAALAKDLNVDVKTLPCGGGQS